MARATAGAAVVAVVMLAARADATITLELRVDAALREQVAVHVGARNIGEEMAANALPEVTLLGQTVWGTEPTTLSSGYVAAWDATFPRPTALGTLPIVVQLHYTDATGHAMSAPAVHVLRTAGTPASQVGVTLETTPVADTGTATVRIDNRDTDTVTGTLALVTPTGLVATPAERPVEIAPGGTLTVPVTIANRTALPDSTMILWAYVTLTRPSFLETVTASATLLTVAPAAPGEDRTTMLLALAGVAALAVLLWGARRLSKAPTPPASRAARRRTSR